MAIQAQMYSDSGNLGFPMGGSCVQDLLTDNGGTGGLNNFSFNLQQQKQQPAHMQYLQLQNTLARNQDFRFDNRFLHQAENRSMFSPTSSLAPQMEKHKLEIDLLIGLQYERLRLALQEQRKQQLGLMIKNCESRAQILLQQKDEEIANGLNRMMELEQLLKGIETENQTWERVAKEHESIIVSMNKTIEQLQEGACQSRNGGGVEDAESCCDIGLDYAKTEEKNTGIVQENQGNGNMTCKICNSRSSCVILLPCRHLCSCNACEAFIDLCPVCNMLKKASIEALF